MSATSLVLILISGKMDPTLGFGLEFLRQIPSKDASAQWPHGIGPVQYRLVVHVVAKSR